MPQRDYELPRDQTESTRLETQHKIYVQNLGYVLNPTIAAAIPSSALIADVGTGTGAWSIDLASSQPGYTFEGLDMSDAQFPKSHPDKLSFRILNILEPIPEDLKGRYDVVHLRLLVCGLSGGEWQTTAKHAFEMLKPGGWIQWCESDFDNIEAVQNQPCASREAVEVMMRIFFEGLHKAGKLQGDARALPKTLQSIGFENVKRDIVSSDRLSELRERSTQIGQGALAGITKTIVNANGFDGMTVNDVEGLVERVREELAGGKLYWRWSIHTVIGRKPGQ